MFNKGSRSKVIRGMIGWLYFLILFGILGYGFYNRMDGVVTMLILWTIYGLVAFLALIPYCAAVVHGLITYFVVWPWISAILGTEATLLTGAMFWTSLVYGLIIVNIMTAVFFKEERLSNPTN